ncbi:MAG: hypothetical protein AAGF95_25740 [Chloroflexota bacterium]
MSPLHYLVLTQQTSCRSYCQTGASLRNEQQGWLFVVCDNVDTRTEVNYQCQTVANTICQYYYQDTNANCLQKLQCAFHQTNAMLYQQRRTTGAIVCAAVLTCNSILYTTHVGNCRVYRYRKGSLQRLTEDHTLAARLVRLAQITKEQLYTHPHSLDKVYQVLGEAETIDVDASQHSLNQGDRILLCTSGLYRYISDAVLSQVMAHESLQDATRRLREEVSYDMAGILIDYG